MGSPVGRPMGSFKIQSDGYKDGSHEKYKEPVYVAVADVGAVNTIFRGLEVAPHWVQRSGGILWVWDGRIIQQVKPPASS